MKRLHARAVGVAVMAGAAVSAAAFAVATIVSSDEDSNVSTVAAVSDDEIFPSSELAHWVTYPTHAAVVSIVAEAEIPPPPEVEELGEGYVGRNLTMRIDDIVWTASPANLGVAGGRLREGNTIDFVADGWLLKDDDLIPFASDGSERLEVGQDYLLPLVPTERGWGWLSASAVMPLDDAGRIASDVNRSQNAAAASLAGMPPGAVGEILADTKPDPRAERFADLPPEARANAVLDS